MKTIGSYIIALLALGIALYVWLDKPKIVAVDLSKVYEGFEMKKQSYAQLEQVVNARKLKMDSMELHLKSLAGLIQQLPAKSEQKTNQIIDFNTARENYLRDKKRFEEDNQNMVNTAQQEILKQLNQYISDYGKMKGYDCVMGANGSGSLMYIHDRIDITAEAITYVNQRFKENGK